ncbi:AAA family ATPase [Candidatus Woesearchaeota archaeon]|nr:AAA family ATPase [Candidatus Woesearchaeota archaeon]
MPLFKDILGHGETLFRNELALDFSFQPKMVPYREAEQKEIAFCIKPLFQNRTGKNCIITGSPGIGKTVATRHILRELEEETDEIIPVYLNCWQRNTSYKVALELCEQLGYAFTHNKKTEELLAEVKKIVNKKTVVFVFDEVDKLEELDFLYYLLEEVYRKSIILITNYPTWVQGLDQRLRSRLVAEIIAFKPYTLEETKGILEQRKEAALMPDVCAPEAFAAVVERTYTLKDLRQGLHLLRHAALLAEDAASTRITPAHVQKALAKIDDMKIKPQEELEQDEQDILTLVKENSGKKIGDLFQLYQQKQPTTQYKTFQRRIKKLSDNKFVFTEKILGGTEGTTTKVSYQEKTRKLDEF